MKKKYYIPLVVFLSINLFLYLQLSSNRPVRLIEINRPLPELLKHKISDYIKTKPSYLIHVVASWCGACKYEHKFIQSLASDHIPIIGIIYKDNPLRANDWLEKSGNPYQQIIYDPDGSLGLELGVTSIPQTFLISDHHLIIHKLTSPINKSVWQTSFQPYFTE